MTRALVLALLLFACGTSAQSARPVAPGKTEFTASLGRAASLKEPSRIPSQADDPFVQGIGEGAWMGELMIRRGIVDGLDAGLRLGRIPGVGGLSVLAIDPKVRLVRSPRAILSVGVPAGIGWEETPDMSYIGAIVVPTVYVGLELSPTIELVAAPKLHLLFERREPMEKAWGFTLAPRFSDPQRRWAVQPELGFTWFGDAPLLLLGLSVSAGN